MEEKTYVGYAFGSFRDDQGVNRSYCSVYMLEPFTGDASGDRHFDGQRAAKYRCESPDVFQKVAIGSRVKCYFTSAGKLAYMQPVSDRNGKD